MKNCLDAYLNKMFRASVLKNMGVNIPENRRFNCSTKEATIEKGKDNYVVYFALPFDPELWVELDVENRAVPYDGIWNVPDKNAKCREIIEITYDDISEMFKALPVDEQIKVSRWLSKEAREEFERKAKEIKEQAISKIKDLPLIKLTREETKANFLHLLYCMNYSALDNAKCWEAYNKNWDDFPGKPDMVSDNRAFYTLDDGNYFVISKNLYDTFFASQGNGFESCFSLTSSHKYIRGVPYWMSHKGYYMCYITDGDVTKWSAIPDHKLKLPKMSCRAWGYKLVNGRFGIGKSYNKTQDRNFMWNSRLIAKIFPDCSPKEGTEVDAEHFDVSKYSVYYDNLNAAYEFSKNGMGGQGRSSQIEPVYSTLKNVKFNKDIEFMPKATLSDGMFIPVIMLPKSGLVDTKINRIIEDMLSEASSVEVRYCLKKDNGDNEQLKIVIGENIGPSEIIYILFSFEGKISIRRKGSRNETIIASV